MKKDTALVILVGLIIVVGLGIYGFMKISNKNSGLAPQPIQTAAGSSDASSAHEGSYFAEDAKVMYFYSDWCHWCQKEKEEVLPELGKLGLKVKPMNVGTDPSLGQKYNVTGTPTFIAANGDRLVGFQNLESLKDFVEKHN